jgi:hypothetical protein
MSAFGAKRTSRERSDRGDLTKMTQSRHESQADRSDNLAHIRHRWAELCAA